jgi:CRP/FNR family cyclic AMP-dependent transcriptional regulator
MTEAESLATLSSHSFTRGLNEPHRKRLAVGARPFAAAPGALLFREAELAHAFYLITSGHVAIGMHLGGRGDVPIQTVGAGEVVGWSWLLPPFRWQFDARAEDAVAGLSFDAVWLRGLCEQDHDLGFHLVKHLLEVVAGRVASARLARLDIYK